MIRFVTSASLTTGDSGFRPPDCCWFDGDEFNARLREIVLNNTGGSYRFRCVHLRLECAKDLLEQGQSVEMSSRRRRRLDMRNIRPPYRSGRPARRRAVA